MIFILFLIVLINDSVHVKKVLIHLPTAKAQTGLLIWQTYKSGTRKYHVWNVQLCPFSFRTWDKFQITCPRTSKMKVDIYLKNKEKQKTLWFIVCKQYDTSFSANDMNSWKQYVCVKLQQVQRNYRLRNHAGMSITSLTPVVNCWNMLKKAKFERTTIFFLAHLNRRLIGELIVYQSLRGPSLRPWVHTFKNMNISETSWRIIFKFHMEHHCGGGFAALGFGPDQLRTLISMATDSSHRVIMGKSLWPL